MSRTATISKNGTRPGHVIGEHWVWVEYPALDIVGENFAVDEETNGGFAVEVLKNPNGADDRMLQLAYREYLKRIIAASSDQDLSDDAEADYYRVIAARIRRWNAQQRNIKGEIVPVPAPTETDDPDAFRSLQVLTWHLQQWVEKVVREITLPKRRTPVLPSVGAGVTTTPTETPPDMERQGS